MVTIPHTSARHVIAVPPHCGTSLFIAPALATRLTAESFDGLRLVLTVAACGLRMVVFRTHAQVTAQDNAQDNTP
jgi:hypothetical protein